jgi:hypothetical protein
LRLSSAVCSVLLAALGPKSAVPELRRPWATPLTGCRPCCCVFDEREWCGFEEVREAGTVFGVREGVDSKMRVKLVLTWKIVV